MRLRPFVILVLSALVLAGCGVRGSLEAPPSAATPEAAPAPMAQEDERSFILDGLLM